ncbi:helix-turn-helix domain-containing protein, partial [Rhodococcus aetherivorans]|uniref:helix-turn-helix domain-containing protein n=1 Tax=Rhodococcus aetherivorans TaxID=191292 RepID=UPI0016117A95
MKGAAAARAVGVSTSCGSLWFLDAGGVLIPEPTSTSSRFLTQDDRIAIADGILARQPVKQIAAAIGKSFQTVYREIKRNSKPDGRYQPWWAHNQALGRRKRPKETKLRGNETLRAIVHAKLDEDWSPRQIARYLTRTFGADTTMASAPKRSIRVCSPAIWGARKASCGPDATAKKAAPRRRFSEQDQEHAVDPSTAGGGQRTSNPRPLGGRLGAPRGAV